ncbi:serine/threonine-protein kinase [Pseudomonas caspiana]|uniref:serine/threonine-protein kinase n=1 Tax=Pseudomonas caspiana TaxID=1451454 RepID=UPI0032EC4B51
MSAESKAGLEHQEVGALTQFALAGGLGVAPRMKASSQSFNTRLPDVLCGRYRLEEILGAGGMSVVYRARDLLHEQFGDPDPFIAIKLLNDDFAEVPDAGVLLYREFALTRHLCHPYIIRLRSFEVDLSCRRAFVTQDLLRGTGLDKFLCEQPSGLNAAEVKAVAVPLLDALAHSHESGVLHGDLKPANMMLTDNGPRLIDFGLGGTFDGVLSGLPRLSRERFDAWTPSYAAPELLEDGVLSPSTDVYAMACVLYELASGKHPYGNRTSIQARDEQLWRSLSGPPNLPVRFWPALRHALSLDSNKRTISAQELHDAFCTRPIGYMQF